MAVSNGHASTNGINSLKSPGEEMVDALQKQTRQAHVRNLSRLANLTTPVLHGTVKRDSIDSTVEEILAHGATTTFFGEIFSLIQRQEISREELDQKLVNWLLKVPQVKERLDALPKEIRTHVEEFKDRNLSAEGIGAVGQGFEKPMTIATARKCAAIRDAWEKQYQLDGGRKFHEVVENNGEPVRYVEKLLFQNWGETVENTPAITFIPKSVVGVQNIVKYAKEIGKKVRVSGYRHTWTNLYSNDDEILISLLPIDTAVDLPSIQGTFKPGQPLLQQIQLLPSTVSPDNTSILCKIGTATTNEQFRKWALHPHGGAGQWTLPLNVIMVEITFGGSISAMCHGAGLRNKTLSDLVVEVEFVDPNGVIQTVSDPELLRAAAGALGMLGVVTAYTVRLDRMTYAAMRPFRSPIELAIPPPEEYIIAARAGDPKYSKIKELTENHTTETLDAALKEFIYRAENYYYAEWFWFPLQRDVWVNAWNNDGIQAQSRNIPNNFEAFLEWLEEWIAEEITEWTIWKLLPGDVQAKIWGFLTLLQMPNITESDPSLTTELINALHFRRGIQNMRVVDMEWEIPIPAQRPKPEKRMSQPTNVVQRNLSKKHKKALSLPNHPEATTLATQQTARDEPAREPIIGKSVAETTSAAEAPKRDWTVVQKAWWDAILLMYENPSIVRVALEMRIMGDGDIILAPQRGNTLGTCSIEILSTLDTPSADWAQFCQTVTDKWISYTDRSTGKALHARPHWCKQWSFLTLPDDQGGKIKASEWIRKIGYKNELPEFQRILKRIGDAAGFTLSDLRARFGNEMLENIFWNGSEKEEVNIRSHDKGQGIVNRIKKWFNKHPRDKPPQQKPSGTRFPLFSAMFKRK